MSQGKFDLIITNVETSNKNQRSMVYINHDITKILEQSKNAYGSYETDKKSQNSFANFKGVHKKVVKRINLSLDTIENKSDQK